MLFLAQATQQGYSAEAAQRAFDQVRARLAERGLERTHYYIFRSGGAGGAGGGESGASAPSRRLPAFPSADAAISFAQAGGLGKAPRLAALSLDQLLAALIQRPSIAALLFVDEDAPRGQGWPPGLWVARGEVLGALGG